jgi:23S rRNA (cytidine2498-2'-O)-methyltransferase
VRGHATLEHLRSDAFSFAPDVPFDWLLCDVIAVPEKSIALLERWLAERWCRRFVLTLKFKGEERAPDLARLRDVLERAGARARVKHLFWSKNEATAVGELQRANTAATSSS